jgi:ribA/ribD-fused uncharacterized protein
MSHLPDAALRVRPDAPGAPLPRDREALLAAVRAGREFSYRVFYGHAAPRDGRVGDHVFSQWFPAPFEADGVRYATAEHWMMAGKARLFGDAEMLAAIVAAPSPASAKAFGRKVRGFDDAAWKRHRFAIVVAGNVHKFAADPRLRAYLLATGDAILVEAAPRDRVWGIGLGAQHAHTRDPSRWRGANLLGFALVSARDALRAAIEDHPTE